LVKLLIVADEALIPPGVHAQEVLVATPQIIHKIAGVVSAEGILAEVAMPTSGSLQGYRRVLALDGVSDPGNMGTLLRTALAFGWEGVFLVENCCDPFNDKALRAAMGATFRLPLRTGTFADLQQLVKENGWHCLVADLEGEDPARVDCNQSLLLILGSEAHGPSAAARQLGQAVTLPMKGAMESLNVSIAGVILMFLLK
jgi:TrmH family RNA methyltransferase